MRTLILLSATFLLSIPGLAGAQNSRPIADAGPDQDLAKGSTTLLEGSATDPDGNDIQDWLWTVEVSPPGSNPWISDAQRPDAQFSGDVAGDYILSLVAFDGMVWSLPDSVTIHVFQILPPVAVVAADPTSGPAPLTVQYDGSASYSPNGFPLTLYDWIFDDGSDPVEEISPSHTYTFPGTFNTTLSVADSLGQISSDNVTITVTAPCVADVTTADFSDGTFQNTVTVSTRDFDGVTLFSDALLGYVLNGTYESNPFDAGEAKHWLVLSWVGVTPSGTTVSYETRASTDGISWSSWYPVGQDGSVVGPIGAYVQYRATLATSDSSVAPVIDEVSLDCSTAPSTGVEQEPAVGRILLYANQPNPFHSATVIRYELAEASPVELSILDLLGRRLRTLESRPQAPGQYEIAWDGRDDAGRRVGAGVYFYRLRAGSRVTARRLVILQ